MTIDRHQGNAEFPCVDPRELGDVIRHASSTEQRQDLAMRRLDQILKIAWT
jgi:hypothetical protein